MTNQIKDDATEWTAPGYTPGSPLILLDAAGNPIQIDQQFVTGRDEPVYLMSKITNESWNNRAVLVSKRRYRRLRGRERHRSNISWPMFNLCAEGEHTIFCELVAVVGRRGHRGRGA